VLRAARLIVEALTVSLLDTLAIAAAVAQRVPFLTADQRFGSAAGAHFAVRWPGPLSGNP
jgi:hypothetical protein